MNNLDKENEEVVKEENKGIPEENSNEHIDVDLEENDINESEEPIPEENIETGDAINGTDEVVESVESDYVEETIEGEVIVEQSIEEQMREFHRNLVEASLYAAGRPLTIEELSNKLELPKKEVEELINQVAFDYLDRSTALVIAQIGDRYQMQIKPEYTEKVSKFAKGGAIAERYLRTLTVIALKQPLLKSTVIKLRGTGAYEHVKYLIDNGFIDAVKKGRSHELSTTDKYADMFGLPKDKRLLKQAMITQLGVEEVTTTDQPENIYEQEEPQEQEEPEQG
ncbi:MAG: SMC-Scp complex subunit ScpB [Promethearchaeota archaeon]